MGGGGGNWNPIQDVIKVGGDFLSSAGNIISAPVRSVGDILGGKSAGDAFKENFGSAVASAVKAGELFTPAGLLLPMATQSKTGQDFLQSRTVDTVTGGYSTDIARTQTTLDKAENRQVLGADDIGYASKFVAKSAVLVGGGLAYQGAFGTTAAAKTASYATAGNILPGAALLKGDITAVTKLKGDSFFDNPLPDLPSLPNIPGVGGGGGSRAPATSAFPQNQYQSEPSYSNVPGQVVGLSAAGALALAGVVYGIYVYTRKH